MTNKDDIKNQALSEDELGEVSGGGCWFGAKDVAPDGHDIGCTFAFSWYENWDEYKYRKGICPQCGGKLSEEKYVSSSSWKNCLDCGYSFHNKWGA